jgi:hypothetical protein
MYKEMVLFLIFSRASMFKAAGVDVLAHDTPPVSTRSVRSVKRLQSGKKQGTRKKKPSRALDISMAQSREKITEKANSVSYQKSKTFGVQTKSGRRRDISVDVKISMPGIKNNRLLKPAKQSYSDSALLSSSESTVGALSDVAEASPILKKRSPQRKTTKSSRKSHGDTKTPTKARSLPEEGKNNTFKKRALAKKSASKIPTRARKNTSKEADAASFGSISSLESIDISFSKPKVNKSVHGDVGGVSSEESLGVYSDSRRRSKRMAPLTPDAESGAGSSGTDLLQHWSPFHNEEPEDWTRDVSEQASFTTPPPPDPASPRKRHTPRKAIKILGKSTPSSKPIKRKKTPGRLTLHRQHSTTQGHRKRRSSMSDLSELSTPPTKRYRGKKDLPEPSFWDTWCTIL